MNSITRARINPTIGMIPTSYKISMTYEEQLVYFCNKLDKELIPTLNDLIIQFNDNQINFDELNLRMDEVENKFKDLVVDMNNLQQQIYNEVDSKNNQLYNSVINLLNDYVNSFNLQINLFKQEIESEIARIELGDVKAYDPTTGEYENVSQVILNVYDSLRNNALTVTEFEALDLTATDFDALEVSAYNFDVNGKTFVHA